MPDLNGKRALVTGPTAGLGTSTALELARAGAEVVLVARSKDKLDATIAQFQAELPAAVFRPVIADLADQSSVRRAASEISTFGPIDILINNAGVMALPYSRTVDGFEMQFGTNHLGPFLLTGLLLPQVIASGHGRIVSVGSHAARFARRAPLDDPRTQERRYSKWSSYGESKLANLMFAFELDQRLTHAGLPVTSIAAHPGYTATELMGKTGGLGGRFMHSVSVVLGQKAEFGALPTLMAATAELPGASYIGPDGFGQMAGLPTMVKPRRRFVHDAEARERLWKLSEEATGIKYP
ncbi:SDR family NAD(P)-dependent oxidoreductase [Nocardioides marmorisolisilvae]|uniref:SDR family NAD(P)-dependent oxidoreductase n=2 Tax=Nocardioides marmorisolisilvae TaxID=1542737 RepID=A0A3N0DQQ1_9ACTN|nr:SDR family NAD(P)-dependent oxidoreductase [Nocardioides marmorisolisilvae]